MPNALRKPASYEQSISPATLETNSIYVYLPDEKLKIYGDLMRIITAQSMEYFSSRPPEHKQMILFCLDEFASFGKLQITEALRKLRKRHIRIMVLTQSLADLDIIYGNVVEIDVPRTRGYISALAMLSGEESPKANCAKYL